ncbi:rubrerythrin [bacterium SM23_57]|jgi:rubrerythrin|nr:MAG: rubrerythrin [bacterium SM23_57]
MRKMTEANLKEAFAGESQAHMKYLAFADKAEREGLPEAARLFTAIAYAERVHAINHLRQLGGIGDTATNLGVAMEGENYENTEMYPAFEAVAKLQSEKGALRSIIYAMEAEKIHEVMYQDAQEIVKTGKDLPAQKVYICSVCGHTIFGEAPDRCPICKALKAQYKEF